MSLRVFLQIDAPIEIKIKNLSNPRQKFIVDSSVNQVRPIAMGAILRNIKFTEETLKGFMELQEKLHNNVCRGRTLVSMGTHDLDTVKGPFVYKAQSPNEIKFKPLNRKEEIPGTDLLRHLSEDPKLKHYVHLLQSEPLFPIIYDSNGVVLSLPPLINSEHSRITTNTKNVFIDITAKDKTKANIVLNTLIAAFSYYCEDKFTVEEIELIESDGSSHTYPQIHSRKFKTDIHYLNSIAGIKLTADEIAKLLLKMGLMSEVHGDEELIVTAPVYRTDVLHPCDIAEDLAIAYGYNNIVKEKPKTVCNGYQQPINKLTDLIRLEMSLGGFVECLTMALLSRNELFANMLIPVALDTHLPSEEELRKVVHIGKSKTPGFEFFRNSLIPGILKTIEANQTNQVYLIYKFSFLIEYLKYQM
jgi:phenylalanyl-tRNA synthetase beta chain